MQRTIELSLAIDLTDLQQVNAYHNLLLAVGGHATSTLVVATTEQAAPTKPSRSRKVAEPATAEPATAEPATAEPATAEPATAEPAAKTITPEIFRQRVARITMRSQEDRDKVVNHLRTTYDIKEGRVADLLTPEQLVEAYQWMSDNFNVE